MYPEQVWTCSGILLLFFNRLAVLVEQLASAVRRLAGDILHRHALAEIGLVVRCGEVNSPATAPGNGSNANAKGCSTVYY